MSMVKASRHVEVINFMSEHEYMWASVPISSKATQVKEVLRQLPWDIIWEDQSIGIWSKPVKLDHLVESGDRIEVYQPLKLTPNEIRLRRKQIKRPDVS